MGKTWECPKCFKENDNDRDGMRCRGCGFGGSLKSAEPTGAPQINHAEVCGANSLYQEMMRRAREIQHLPREELVKMSTTYSAEFDKKITGDRHV